MMAVFANFIRAIFNRNLGFWSDYFTRSIAVKVAWVATAVGFLLAFAAGVNAILAGLTVVMPSFITIPASWIMPDNFDQCVAAYFTALTLKFAFEWKYKVSSHLTGALR